MVHSINCSFNDQLINTHNQEIAQKLISSTVEVDDNNNPINPVDARFRSLGLSSMDPIQPGSKEYNALEAYARDTHGETHRHYQVHLQHAFRVERCVTTGAAFS